MDKTETKRALVETNKPTKATYRKVEMKKILLWLISPYTRWKDNREAKKRLEELKKRDPFIYK